MNIYIAVVSHNHGNIIKRLGVLSELSNRYKVVIKNNIKDGVLSSYCNNTNIDLLDSDYGLGFGGNNNFIFEYCMCNYNISEDDIFIVLNPDVYITELAIESLARKMSLTQKKLVSIKLFKDFNKSKLDRSARKFPSFLGFLGSFLGVSNSTDVLLENNCDLQVDWCAGSFLAFKASHFLDIKGFDENYFMYCEDTDICFRSHLLSERIQLFTDIEAIHLAERANRVIFSKHFYWHLKSAFRFLLVKLNPRLVKFNSRLIKYDSLL
ncbi:glycosyltransferase family 2 protein [Vibrio crassostreae]|uniref:glycosyltransferase family 2 protein n=1 Tax=Vibrio crassostreae TaxID=246167 RepID=UPI000305BD5E|nr:glycosyltransferase family 2 protein [Vibrio crassostreae]OEE90369.1 hypothetical protein A140_03385 [Vibrio crassostreae 9ZC88]